jgi:hypothetical protein
MAAVVCCLVLFFVAAAPAQAPNQAQPANQAPVSYTSIAELNQMISNLQQASQSTQNDLSHLRIDKWKTDSGTKRQTQADTESILRNLQNAMPSMIADLKNSPENLALTFKLYRNLDALYDVLNSAVESTGAFGSKDEFRSLSQDLSAIDQARRGFADRMDKLATVKDNEIGQLRVALQNARAAEPPKKVVVDDTAPEPAKPPIHKKTTKKPANKKPPSGTNASPGSNSSTGSTSPQPQH